MAEDLKIQNAALSDRAAVVDRFEQELQLERQRLRDALTELNELRTGNAELKEKAASVFVLERNLVEEKNSIKSLQDSLESERKSNQQLLSDLETCQAALSSLRAQHHQLRHDLAQNQKEAEQKLNELITEKTDFEKQIIALVEAMTKQVVNLKADISTREQTILQEINERDSRLKKLCKTTEDIQSIKSKLRRQLSDQYRLEITNLSEELETVKNEKATIENVLRQKENDLLFQSEHLIPDFKQKLTSLSDERDELQAKLNIAEKTYKNADVEKVLSQKSAETHDLTANSLKLLKP